MAKPFAMRRRNGLLQRVSTMKAPITATGLSQNFSILRQTHFLAAIDPQRRRLERDGAAGLGKRGEGGGGLGQSEDLGVAVAGGIHGAEIGVGVEHVLLGSQFWHLHGLGGHTQPALAVEGADLHLGIGQHLPGDVLAPAGLDGELAVLEIHGAEGAHPRLRAVQSGQVVGAAGFQKFIYFLHGTSLLFLHFNP